MEGERREEGPSNHVHLGSHIVVRNAKIIHMTYSCYVHVYIEN